MPRETKPETNIYFKQSQNLKKPETYDPLVTKSRNAKSQAHAEPIQSIILKREIEEEVILLKNKKLSENLVILYLIPARIKL